MSAAGTTRRRAPQHATTAQRVAAGRAARTVAPRRAQGEWEAAADREPAVTILERQAATRVAELLPIRYGRMAASPFAFFRGAAAIMAADLAGSPRTGLEVQLCGDAHLANFGGFAAPDRRLVFSINDFDETLPGPFEWDVKRLVASFAVAGRSRDFGTARRASIVRAAAGTYRRAMRTFAGMSALDVWYTRLDVDQIVRQFQGDGHARQLRTLQRAADKAESKDGLKALARLTKVVDGVPAFVSDPPVVVPMEELVGAERARHLRDEADKLMRSYLSSLPDDRRVLVDRYRFTDIARKVVGVGSVGTRTWVVLLLGRNQDDPLLLQFKEAQPSVLEPYLGPSRYRHHGQRIVEGQRLMQAASDILLGWQRPPGFDGVDRHYFVRQLWDKKGSAEIDVMAPRGMQLYAEMCGWTLARAHARSGDSMSLAAYLGGSDTFDGAMVEFAEAYADQNELDHAALQRAIADGTVTATVGV
jgi:uncharacterized protein (DUF2252 family)